MLVDHELESSTTFQSGTRALLTTADPNADDGFPYVGDGSTSTHNSWFQLVIKFNHGEVFGHEMCDLSGGAEAGCRQLAGGGAVAVEVCGEGSDEVRVVDADGGEGHAEF